MHEADVLQFTFISDLLSGCLAQAPNTNAHIWRSTEGGCRPRPVAQLSLLPPPSPPLGHPPSSLSPPPHPSLQESCSLAIQGLGLASDVASLWTAVTSRISLWLPGCGLRRGLRRSASLSRLMARVWMPVPRCALKEHRGRFSEGQWVQGGRLPRMASPCWGRSLERRCLH